MFRRGKFIVIDGIDGVGKATQTGFVVERLRRLKRKVQTIDFPRYDTNFFGALIGECLAGKYGDFIAVPPRIASVLYAADRLESAPKIRKWIASGHTVIADRYTSSNQIHQGGKIHDEGERRQFLRWLDRMEHEVFGIPRPDAIIYLSLPVEMSQQLLEKKSASLKKAYLAGRQKDVAEQNLDHMRESRESAFSIVGENNNWYPIDCSEGDRILTKAEIHEQVWTIVSKLLKLKN